MQIFKFLMSVLAITFLPSAMSGAYASETNSTWTTEIMYYIIFDVAFILITVTGFKLYKLMFIPPKKTL